MAGRHFALLDRFFSPSNFGLQQAYPNAPLVPHNRVFPVLVGIRFLDTPFSWLLNDEPLISTPRYNVFWLDPTIAYAALENRLRLWLPGIQAVPNSRLTVHLSRLRSNTSVAPNAYANVLPLLYDHVCIVEPANCAPVLDFLAMQHRDLYILSVIIQNQGSINATRAANNHTMGHHMMRAQARRQHAAGPNPNMNVPHAPMPPRPPAPQHHQPATAARPSRRGIFEEDSEDEEEDEEEQNESSEDDSEDEDHDEDGEDSEEDENEPGAAAVRGDESEELGNHERNPEDLPLSSNDEDGEGDGIALEYNSPTPGTLKRTPRRDASGGAKRRMTGSGRAAP